VRKVEKARIVVLGLYNDQPRAVSQDSTIANHLRHGLFRIDCVHHDDEHVRTADAYKVIVLKTAPKFQQNLVKKFPNLEHATSVTHLKSILVDTSLKLQREHDAACRVTTLG
jgi:hypothetical protein